jgi:uncharacterized protein (TIGR03083 family)
MALDTDATWAATKAERLALADLLESLAPADWDTQSLCSEWRVRDVAAHVTLSSTARPMQLVLGTLRNFGNIPKFIAEEARGRGAALPVQLVAELRAVADSRHHPFGTTDLDPLADVLIHTQDIAIPVGRDHPMPLDAAAAAADRVWTFTRAYGGKKLCKGLRVQATDADWGEGEGELVEGPMASVLIAIAGRAAGLDKLAGPGVATLASRL